MTAAFTKPSSDPSLVDVLNQFKKDILISLNCHAIATVQSFDSEAQTVTATINYTKSFMQRQEDGSYIPVAQNYPILLDVPIIILGGGNASLTFPIAKGDECLILFNDRDIDNWFNGQNTLPPATSRLHSFSDGIALVGFRDIASYDTDSVVIKNGTNQIKIGSGFSDPNLIKISNSATSITAILDNISVLLAGLGAPTVDLNILISQLFDAA